MGIATCMFGLSTHIWQMIMFRLLAGASAGTMVTIRTMFSEVSTKKTEARAFSLFAFSSNIGIFLGPLLGGVLSKPAENFPIFRGIHLFERYPYFLPPFVAGILAIISALLNLFLLKETLPPQHASHKSAERTSVRALLSEPKVNFALFIYMHVMLLGLANTAIMPLIWFTPVSLSGFGFSPLMISIFLGGAGVAQALWLLIAFPYLTKKMGTMGNLRFCAIWWPISLLGNILANALLRNGQNAAFWAFAPVFLAIGSGCSMSFTGIQLALNAASPSQAVLGTLNGIALSANSGVRTFAPAAFSSLFAYGVRDQILSGYLAVVVLTVLAGLHTVVMFWPTSLNKDDVDERRETES
jgi:MFS family permease